MFTSLSTYLRVCNRSKPKVQAKDSGSSAWLASRRKDCLDGWTWLCRPWSACGMSFCPGWGLLSHRTNRSISWGICSLFPVCLRRSWGCWSPSDYFKIMNTHLNPTNEYPSESYNTTILQWQYHYSSLHYHLTDLLEGAFQLVTGFGLNSLLTPAPPIWRCPHLTAIFGLFLLVYNCSHYLIFAFPVFFFVAVISFFLSEGVLLTLFRLFLFEQVSESGVFVDTWVIVGFFLEQILAWSLFGTLSELGLGHNIGSFLQLVPHINRGLD